MDCFVASLLAMTEMHLAPLPCPCGEQRREPLLIFQKYLAVEKPTLRRRLIFHLIFGLPALLVITRFLAPLELSLSVKCVVAILLLAASQYH